MGYLPLREAIADYLGTARALRCEPSQILVTTGSRQGLQLAAAARRGRRGLCGGAGISKSPARVLSRRCAVGADPRRRGGRECRIIVRKWPRARAIYVTPSHQYTMGMTLSANRRMQLLRWAKHSGAWIIEDDYDSEDDLPAIRLPLQGMDADAKVVYLGTFSKVMLPALRLGYVVAPKDLVPAFAGVLDAAGIFTSPLTQTVLSDFIREGHLARHSRRMRVLYMERREALVKALQSVFGDALQISGAEPGIHLVVRLPDGTDDREMARCAAAEGLSVMPLSSCFCGAPSTAGLVLGYGGTRHSSDTGWRAEAQGIALAGPLSGRRVIAP